MWPNPQFPADLVSFTKEILNGKLHFLCSVLSGSSSSLEAIVTSFLPPLLLGSSWKKSKLYGGRILHSPDWLCLNKIVFTSYTSVHEPTQGCLVCEGAYLPITLSINWRVSLSVLAYWWGLICGISCY